MGSPPPSRVEKSHQPSSPSLQSLRVTRWHGVRSVNEAPVSRRDKRVSTWKQKRARAHSRVIRRRAATKEALERKACQSGWAWHANTTQESEARGGGLCECVEREGRCARKGVVRLPVCRCLESERVGGGIERKRVTSLRGWGDLSMDGGEGRRIANPRGSEESWFERKAEKGGKRDASASRSEGVGRGGGWIGRVACVTRDFGLIGLPLGRGIG